MEFENLSPTITVPGSPEVHRLTFIIIIIIIIYADWSDQAVDSNPVPAGDEDLSLAQRRPRRNHQLPIRFRDDMPQPLCQLPPATEGYSGLESRPSPQLLADSPPLPSSSASHAQPVQSLGLRIRRIFRTPRNIFGLFRQYHSKTLPSHDPEEHVESEDLYDPVGDQPDCFSDAQPLDESQPQKKASFYPYSNKNSFLLGNWYWNGGVQKSRQSFSDLLDIVGSSEFNPGDVRDTKWGAIDAELARDNFDGDVSKDGQEDAEWLDDDAGWQCTPINISVPFHSRARTPGPQDYLVGHLYHRSLISVLREKLANPHDDRHFHYEPYELLWSPTDSSPDIRVHGELYTSPAFMDAHHEVQALPGEPGCNLPRVVAAMMFWSDATHLTSFGTAKLWPCYMYFGNETKYRRCKPSCNLCNHVAYFQTVCCTFVLRLP
jgi:hypothetical protein